jgi:glutathione S-transferase
VKLYYSPGACSLSPHIVSREAELPVELVRVTPSSRELFALHPKGYVPVLELEDGELLTEGPAIVQYLADLAPEQKLAPPAGTRARYRLQEWLNFVTSELHKGFSPLFSSATPEAYKPVVHEKLRKSFTLVDKALQDRPFLMGERFTVADAYLFVVGRWAVPTKLNVSELEHLAAYFARIAERPAVRQALLAER